MGSGRPAASPSHHPVAKNGVQNTTGTRASTRYCRDRSPRSPLAQARFDKELGCHVRRQSGLHVRERSTQSDVFHPCPTPSACLHDSVPSPPFVPVPPHSLGRPRAAPRSPRPNRKTWRNPAKPAPAKATQCYSNIPSAGWRWDFTRRLRPPLLRTSPATRVD